MGQAKYNPTAKAAKRGELPPKEKPHKLTERDLEVIILNYFFGSPLNQLRMIKDNPPGWEERERNAKSRL